MKCGQLADAVKVGIVILDENFKILDVNREIIFKGGVDKERLIGSNFLSWFPEDSLEELKKILGDVKDGNVDWGRGTFLLFSKKFKKNLVVDLRARRVKDNIVVTLIDKSWLYETLDRLKVVESAVLHMDEGLVVTDVDGTIIYVNPAFTRITGYKYEEAIGKNPRILKSGKHPKEFYKEMWDTILSGKVWRGNLINKRKDGTLYWEEMTIVPIKNGQGKITHFVAVKRDVTERKRLEDKLKKREEYYRKIFDMSRDGIFIETLDGKLLDVNEAGASMLGYTREELLKLGIRAIVPEEEMGRFPKIVKELKERGETRLEVLNRHKNGYLVPIELSLGLLKIDGKERVIAIARDLSHRVEEEQKYRILSEMAFDAVILINEEGRIEYWNPAAERIFGYKMSETINKPFWKLIVPPKYLPGKGFSNMIKRGFERGNFSNRKMEVEAMRKDGKIIPVELGITMFNIGGKKYALSIIRDMTERREMEERIKRHMEELAAVHRFSLNLGYVTDLKDLSLRVRDELKKIMNFDDFTIGFVDWERKKIRYEIMLHRGKDLGPIEIDMDDENSLSGWIISHKTPLLIRNMDEEKDRLPAMWFKIGEMPKSWLGVPLTYRDRVVGVLILQSFKPHTYDQRDLEFLSILGAPLSLAIINSQLYTTLKSTMERYRGIIESALVGVAIVSLKGDLIFANERMAQMLGYTLEELKSKNIIELTTERGKRIFKEQLKKRSMGEKSYYENELVKKDGKVINVLINAVPLHDERGKTIGSIAIVIDITNKKREENELRKKNAVLNALYNISTTIGKVPTLSELVESVYQEIKGIFDFRWFYIGLYDKKREEIRYEILRYGDENIKDYVIKYDPKNSLSSWVIKTGKPIVIKNLDREKLPAGFKLIKDLEEKPPRSIIMLPLRYEKEVFGVISLQHMDAEKYSEEDLKYLSTISNALAILIKNIQLFHEVKNAKDRFEAIINTSIVGISTTTLDGTINFVNDKFAEILGYSKEELIGKSVMDLTTEDGKRIFREKLERRGKGLSDYYEMELIRKNGKKIHVLINASPLRDENGNIEGSIGIILDITKRKEMEDQLRREKERYKELFNKMANVVLVIQNRKIMYINKEFEASTGYRREDVIGRDFLEFVHPDTRDIVLNNYKRRIRNGDAPDHYVIKLVAKDGREIWMDIHASLINWEGGRADLVSMIDITYMKEMEDRLIALDEMARELKMAKTRDEIYEIAIENLYKILRFYNAAILELRGNELVMVKSRGYINPKFRIEVDSKRGITAWVARKNLPYYSPNTDEDDLYVEGVKGAKCEYATPISIDDRIYGVLDVQKDEPYSISEDEIKLIDLLANNMAVALKGLENQMELERAKNLQELMLHIVSHDLKNPLAVLNGYIDLLRENFNDAYLDAMQNALDEASRIIEKARLFSKLGAGKIEQEKVVMDIKKEIEDVASLLSQKYPNGKINISMNRVEIKAFPLIREVFVNLIDNAFKYGATAVDVSSRDLGEYVEIRVKDNGPGIPDEKKEIIFNAFETLSQNKGSGLGLSIVKMITDLHDGSIHVEDNKPKGSVFVIRLPKD
ncbi:PAS domain S-box [Aciduliprofundum sp. MAR08-339]|uniref:PAS domain S-box protein n=1 Tax=Aciduliprofundum sp. (strain MAR08-339) TaxID=673860 RepID=UPI0002A49D19|nr:PAS domain S-box [Aciduliprofundum sp. MAR08-339]